MQHKAQDSDLTTGMIGSAGQQQRNTADDWSEEAARQAQAQSRISRDGEQSTYSEFRRKLAGGELLSRAAEKLAAALRFSGRITITFHQGRMTKTVMEEAYFKQRSA